MVLVFTKTSSDLFKEYLSKLLLETGLGELKPVSFFYKNYPPKKSPRASLDYICLLSSI